MFRTQVIAVGVIALATCVAAAAPFRVGMQPETKKPAGAEDRRKIIDEIQTDLDRVLENLNRDDAGAETRKNQKRILAGIDRLLEQQDPEAANSSASQSPQPKPGANAPPTPKPAPKPSPNSSSPVKPVTKQTAAPKPGEPKRPAPPAPLSESKPERENSLSASTLEKMRAEQQLPQGWSPELPMRHRQTLDAFARERFPPGYEELLRAYYRSLAQSGRDSTSK